MDALEKEIQAIIDSDEVTEEASTDTDESIEEAYKTKDQVKAEVDELLSTMKRSELVDAQDKLTPQPEEEVQEADAPDEGGDAKSVPVEDDPNDDDKVFTAEKLKEAYDDVSDDDDEEVDETDDSEIDEAAIKKVVSEMRKALKASKVKVESKKLQKASRSFYKENKKAVQKSLNAKSSKTDVKSSFDPTLNKEEVDVHVEALLEGEGLSDDFKEKASVIFEGAVNSKVDATIENLKEQFDTQLEQATEQVQDELATKVDTYLNYVVEQWLEDNKLAVEKGLRTELTEDFIGGMKTLFEQHYIDVPETKIDIFDDLSERVEELEDKLNAEIDKNIQLEEKLSQSEKEGIIEESAQDLSEIQTEKLKELAGVVDFTTSQEFSDKVQMIKENYFPTTSEPKTKPVDAPEYVGKGGSMERYTQMLSRSIK